VSYNDTLGSRCISLTRLWLTHHKYKKDVERCKIDIAPCGKIDDGTACLNCVVKDCKYAQHSLTFGEDRLLADKIESLKESAIRSLRENDLINALKHTNSILAVKDIDKDALSLKGRVLFMQKHYNEAIECFDKIIHIDAKNVNAINSKGVMLMYLGKYNDAFETFDKAIAISPNSPSAWNNMGVALIYLEKYDAALKCLITATENNINNSEVWYHSGALHYGMENIEDAEKCFDKSLELNRSNEYAKHGKKLLTEQKKGK